MPRLLKNRSEDAYGQELWEYFKKKQGSEVIERDDGYIDPSRVAPRIYFTSIKDWPKVERLGIRYAKGRVLDVGCGAGRVGLYLQRYMKLDVTGIDISPLAVKVSRLRGLRKAKVLAFEDIDFGRASFESIVMFGNNFGLFGSMSRAKRLLRRLHRMTSGDAVIICESLNPHKTANPDHLKYQEQNLRRGRMPGQVRLRARYMSYIGRWFDYLLVSPQEMRNVVAGTGWEISRVIENSGSPLFVGIVRKSRASG
jgi:SAM-dependent methyltransferase